MAPTVDSDGHVAAADAALAPGAGTTGVHVEICSDRACRTPSRASRRPDAHSLRAALLRGVHFWHARSNGVGAYGPTWEFWVGARSAGTHVVGHDLDVNGDGYADVIVGDEGATVGWAARTCTSEAREGSPPRR